MTNSIIIISYIVTLTVGIGSGKIIIINLFKNLGIHVIYYDEISKKNAI
ncbi:hypothetical protein [Buchnera aphidicola]